MVSCPVSPVGVCRRKRACCRLSLKVRALAEISAGVLVFGSMPSTKISEASIVSSPAFPVAPVTELIAPPSLTINCLVLITVLPAFPELKLNVLNVLGMPKNESTPMREIDSETLTMRFPPLPVSDSTTGCPKFKKALSPPEYIVPPEPSVNLLADIVISPALPEAKVKLPKVLTLPEAKGVLPIT